MLVELRIRDFAVLRDLTLRPGPGMTVVTGETGAGKSILVDALSLLLGERASVDSIRTGATRAVVEAVFDIRTVPGIREALDEAGIPDEEGLLYLRREVHGEGRNRAWINGSPVPAGTVGAFGLQLVDLHGQHDHQLLLRTDAQRGLLDGFGGLEPQVARCRSAYEGAHEVRVALEALDLRMRDRTQRMEFLRFQLAEIDEGAPVVGEDEDAERELALLDHAEELVREASAVHDRLYAREGSVSELVAEARDRIRRLSRLDPALAPLQTQLDGVYQEIVEAGRSAGAYAARVDADPRRAEGLRERLARLQRLKRKYGDTLADVVRWADEARSELSTLEGMDLERGGLERALGELEGELAAAAAALSEARDLHSGALGEAVQALLPNLGLPAARFEIHRIPLEVPGPQGAERIEFRASLNPGFEPKALQRIASGGELSRIMLAIKAILARVDRVPTLIFDEVDAGVGGTVANAVGRTLAELAKDHQVFVITHLPQVAARGGAHFRVEKGEESGVASTTLFLLEGEDRVREIARMLGGDPDSLTSLEHAREILTPS
jgi:DNA repair protein RecN (Recombination protein N)